jgi:hypothetical protein
MLPPMQNATTGEIPLVRLELEREPIHGES